MNRYYAVRTGTDRAELHDRATGDVETLIGTDAYKWAEQDAARRNNPDLIDPDDPTVIDWPARQAAALVPYTVVDGRPVNPCRTLGRPGRGELWLWGENTAADPIVTACGHVLLIRRSDCGMWAIPGGMVDPGEYAKQTLVRELAEETGVDLADVEPQVIARTYIDDPRNTDEAWIASTVALFRIDWRPTAVAGDDAEAAGWWRFGSLDALDGHLSEAGGVLYPAHRPLLAAALHVLAQGVTR